MNTKFVVWGLRLAVLGSFLVFPVVASSEEPTLPFGQSNPIVLNTNRIGFGQTQILQISSTPDGSGIPSVTSLGHVAPNPFNPSISISFMVGEAGIIDLKIYDLGGHLIKTLATQDFETGRYTRQWDGRDSKGSLMPAGVYLVRIQGESSSDSKKITLVK